MKGSMKLAAIGGSEALTAMIEKGAQHPDGRKADCHRETGLDPKTIRKWWDCLEKGIDRDS